MISEETHLKSLIGRAKEDDRVAFRELYDLLANRVYAYARSRLSSTEDALDCSQQIFIELWKALRRFEYRTDPEFYSFLFTIIKRQIIRMRQTQRKEPEVLRHEEHVPGRDHAVETEHLIYAVLAKLSDVDRDIVILHHWSRYTFAEIGTMLTLTEANVRVRHHRALKMLRALISE